MIQKSKVAIVTFAGERLGYGTGHLMESILIASEWRSRDIADMVKIKFFVNNFSAGINWVRENGFPFEIYTEGSYEKNPFGKVTQMVRNWGYTIVLITVPALFEKELERLCRQLHPVVVILDNDENQFFSVSALINYNINQDPDFYAYKAHTLCYIGTDYVPLSRRRLDRAKLADNQKFRRGDIVVTLGGTNPNRLALKVLRALFTIDPRYRVRLVLGGGTPIEMRNEIVAWLAEHSMLCNVYCDLPQCEFYELLAKCSCAISAPGNTLYELCYLGVPTAIIAENEQTLRVAESFAERGWCVNLGLGTKLTHADLVSLLRKFLTNTEISEPRNLACSFNGRGVERIIGIMETIIVSSTNAERTKEAL